LLETPGNAAAEPFEERNPPYTKRATPVVALDVSIIVGLRY
jgi:hypothetical protein